MPPMPTGAVRTVRVRRGVRDPPQRPEVLTRSVGEPLRQLAHEALAGTTVPVLGAGDGRRGAGRSRRARASQALARRGHDGGCVIAVSYTHLRAHETDSY